jgi:hypothetical protein
VLWILRVIKKFYLVLLVDESVRGENDGFLHKNVTFLLILKKEILQKIDFKKIKINFDHFSHHTTIQHVPPKPLQTSLFIN